MELTTEGFLRPRVYEKLAEPEERDFRRYCPGISLELNVGGGSVHPIWGPFTSARSGHAADEEARYLGSSGGGLSGLLIFMLESGRAECIVHTAADDQRPTYSKTVVSRTRGDVLRAAGSRYEPASPLVDIVVALQREQRVVFVGKPCDVAGLRNYLRANPHLSNRVALVVSFMCAGTPSDQGTAAILQRLGVERQEVVQFWYRGRGWPGKATACMANGDVRSMDYATSWGTILNRHLQFRCKVCPDGTGEFADVTFADAWYGNDGYPEFEERAGRSLIICRTPIGEKAVADAVRSGHLIVDNERIAQIEAMQPYQANRKRLVLGRLLALLLRRGVIPRFRNLRIVRCAFQASFAQQLRNFLGTLRRLA